jgi:phosphate transport system substrate-binding protein
MQPLRTFIICFSIAFLSLFPASGSPAAGLGYQGTHILTHGALEDLAKAFQKKYGTFVFVKGGGCADGIAAVLHNRHELGGICCPLKPETAKKNGLVSHRVAIDIKAVMMNPKNPLKELTLKQVSDIHTGRITNWRQVGGKDRPIALIYRDHCRDMDEPVRKALGLAGPVAKKAIIVKTDKEVVEYVERFPDAVGIAPLIFARVAGVTIAKVDGAAPTPETAEKGLYPLTGGLFIITRGEPAGLARKFLDFVFSAEGQSIVGKAFGRGGGPP